MVNHRQEWRVSCGHWVVIRTFAMPRAYLRSTKHVQNFKDPVIRSLRCMAGGWELEGVFQRYRGGVDIMSSVSASTESLARIFALGWSKVHSISIILHPRLDILLQVNHLLGEPDSPPPGPVFCTLYPKGWWTFEGSTHLPVMKPCQTQILCLESAWNQETIKALVEGRISPWRCSVDVAQQTETTSSKQKKFEIPLYLHDFFIFFPTMAPLHHLAPEVVRIWTWRWKERPFLSVRGWCFLEIFEIVWKFQFRPFFDLKVSHFLGGSMDGIETVDMAHGDTLLSFWANWVYSEWGNTTSTFVTLCPCDFLPNFHQFSDQAVHIRSSLGQVGHAEGWMESCKALVSQSLSRASAWDMYFLYTQYFMNDISSPSCWCSPKHGGVFFCVLCPGVS